jgi:hypothetical protein
LFPQCALLDALGILYSQYWWQLECEANFAKHLEVLMVWYYEQKMLWSSESNFVIPPLLNCWYLDFEHGMFKLCMKSNSNAILESPFDFNPLPHIWRTIHASRVLTHSFHMHFKLIEMAMVH